MEKTFPLPELAAAAYDAYHVYGFVVGGGHGSDAVPTQEQRKIVGICAEIRDLVRQLGESATTLSDLLAEPLLTADFSCVHWQSTAMENAMRRHQELLAALVYQMGCLKYASTREARVFRGASELDRSATIYQVAPENSGSTMPRWRVRIAHPRIWAGDTPVEEVLRGCDSDDFGMAHQLALAWIEKGEKPI